MAIQLKFNQKALTLTIFAALSGVQLGAQAQSQSAPNDQGSITFIGSIKSTTCLLQIDSNSPSATAAASKTIDFGILKLDDVTAAATGANIGAAVTTSFQVKSPGSPTTTCTFGTGITKWDITGTPNKAATSFSTGTGSAAVTTWVLSNSATAGNGQTVATGVGIKLLGAVNTGKATPIEFSKGSANLSGGATPTAIAADKIVLTSQLVKTSATAAVGAYSATLNLNVVYN